MGNQARIDTARCRSGALIVACWVSLWTYLPVADAADPAPLQGQILSLQFTSDHKLLRRAEDLLSPGERLPDIHWTVQPRRSVPISHTGGDVRIGVLLRLSVPGAQARVPFVLQGTSAEPGLQFRTEGRLPEGDEITVESKAVHPLGRAVRQLSAPITWVLTLHPEGQPADALSLGTTGPHTIYVTAAAPRNTERAESAVTEPRLELAIERVAAARKVVGEDASGPRLVFELMKQNGEHYVPGRHYRRAAAWQVPQSWRLHPPGASCIGIVDFVHLVCDMTGIEGEVRTAAFCARAARPELAVRGGLGDPPEFKCGPAGQTWQLFLVDHTNTGQGQIGGVGGVNYYEGTLEYVWNGKRYYYPGGTDRVYDAPEQVLRVFRTLAWAEYDERLRDWVVREVVHTYVGSGDKFPPSVPLP